MVYPVPLPAPVTPSPANIAVFDEDDGVGAPAIASSTGDAVPAAEPSTPAAPPAVRARPAPLEPPERLRRVPPEYPRFARINNIALRDNLSLKWKARPYGRNQSYGFTLTQKF